MSKNEKKKVGLHKDVSSIFKGVVIPQKDRGKESLGTFISEQTDYAVPKQMDTESQKDEVTKQPYQAVQTLSNAEPAQESKTEPVEEPKVELIEEPKDETIQELKNEATHATKFITAQESKVVPIEESEAEPALETKEKSASPLKFMTAQESKVIPIEESEVEPAQETKDKSVSSPKFVTAQESKVIPIEESEVEPVKESENEPVRQSKFKTAKKPKVIPVQKPKKADIGSNSKKVSGKRPVVKVGGASFWEQITGKLFTAKPGASGTKQKAMVVIVPVLFVVLLIFVFRGGVFGTSVHNAQAGDENNNPSVVPAGSDNQIDWEIPEPYPTTLRDPMQLGPVVTGTKQTETDELVKLIVTGILCSEDNSSALIGNQIVHEGDQIQGANIIKIDKDGVEFEMNGKKWTQKVQR